MTKKHNAIILILFVISMANVLLSYLAQHLFRGPLFSADGLVLSQLFSDLLEKGGEIRDWLLPPAPYFFPDYPVFFLAHVLGHSVYNESIIFALFQIALTFLGTWLLFRQVERKTALYSATAVVIGWLWLALNYQGHFVFLLLSAHHYGVFLSSLFFLALWMKYRSQQGEGVSLLWGMAAIAFLSALSDNLFIVQTLIPFFVMAIFTDLMKRDFSLNKEKVMTLIPVISGVLGYSAYNFIVPNDTRYYADIGFEKITENLEGLFHFYADIVQMPVYGVLFLGYISIIIYSFYCLMKKDMDSYDMRPMVWLSLFSFLSFVSTFCTITLVTNIPLGIRYIIPSLFWPLFVVIGCSPSILGKRFWGAATTFSAMGVISLSSHTYTLIKKNGLHGEYYPREIACIDEALEKAHVSNGVAHFWDARPIQLFSHLDLNIAQHKYPLEEHPYVVSKRFFRKTYDFIVFPGNRTLSFDEVKRINGMPQVITYCGDKTLYIYGKDKMKTKES